MPNPTLYDNFNQVRQYIDQNQVDLSSYVSKSELEGMSYATTSDLSSYILTPNIYGSTPGPYKLYAAGLSANTQYKHIYPNNYSYSNFASLDSNAWMSKNTVKNYVEGRIAEIESTYATQTYVADYVAEHGGGGGSTVIDENIIPKETATYTLGDASHIYSNTYSRGVYLGTGIRMFSESSASSNDMAISLGGVSYYYMNSNRFAPNGAENDNKLSLGTSDRRWLNIYTSNLYLNDNNALYNKTQYQVNLKLNGGDKYVFRTNHLSPASDGGSDLGQSDLHWNNAYINNAYISNYNNFIWTGTAAEYEALSDYTTYQLYLVKDE